MAFIQIIESRTKNFDELQALGDEYFQATEGQRTVRRSILTRDRNDPDRYLIIVFFDSYESAMENSNLPETAAVRREADAAPRRTPYVLRPRHHRRAELREHRWET